MIRDILNAGLKSLFRQQVRSFLTLSGVILGIAAIVCLLSIGQGLIVAVEEQFKAMGTNSVYLVATNPLSGNSGSVTEITEADLKRIESMRGVDEAIPVFFSSGVMEVGNDKFTVSIIAVNPDQAGIFESMGYLDLKEGRLVTENDSQGILMGEKLVDSYSNELNLRKTVRINNEEFKLVGIQKNIQQFVGDINPENMIFMSTNAFRRIDSTPNPLQVIVSTIARDDATLVADEMTEYFEDKYGKKSVYIYTSEQLLEQINQIYLIITIFLSGISVIALIVGGVGIMNAMVTSVIEKTKEIGIMKALGASNFIILMIFVVEAALIGLAGGIIGTVLGYSLSQIIAFFGTQAGFVLIGAVTWDITLIGLGFSTIVGIISGFFPAWRAANLDPVEALRYE